MIGEPAEAVHKTILTWRDPLLVTLLTMIMIIMVIPIVMFNTTVLISSQ